MARAVLLLTLLVGCGRIGFDAASDGDGGTDAPLPVGRWREAAMSNLTGCGITLSAELWCGGSNSEGQLGVGDAPALLPWTQVGTESWTAIDLADEHSCGLKANGSAWCWGVNYAGELGVGVIGGRYSTPDEVSPGSTWKLVRTARLHTCAIRSDDTLWCWGRNSSGQLGISSTTPQTRPAQVGTDLWSSVDVGETHTCGVRSDRTLWCWGSNANGQLGLGTTGGTQLVPAQVSAAAWSDVRMGFAHACAIRDDATLWCWGNNDGGQVGVGDRSDVLAPEQVLADVALVGVSVNHTCAATRAGALACWGGASRGRIPGIDVESVMSPMTVAAPAITKLVTGGATTCVIDDEAHLLCTGASSYGQHGTVVGEVHTPERPDTRTDWQAISAQESHACGIHTDRSVSCWGRGGFGQLGDGAIVDRQRPITVPGVAADSIVVGYQSSGIIDATLTTIWGYDVSTGTTLSTPFASGQTSVQLALGNSHVCRLDNNQTIDCIGGNSDGQIGDGTQNQAAVPFTHGGTWSEIAASVRFTCGTSGSRLLKCWGHGPWTGTNSTGPVVTPTDVVNIATPVDQIALGGDFGCARTMGQVWCWGKNQFAQLGDGTLLDRSVAVRVGTRSDWRDLDAGDAHACAIANDRSLWCWGHGDQGQGGWGDVNGRQTTPRQVGTDLDWADVACGFHFTCAIKTDGTRWCFGITPEGELGNGRGWVTDFVATP